MWNNSQISDRVNHTGGMELQIYTGHKQENFQRFHVHQIVHRRLLKSIKDVISVPIQLIKTQEQVEFPQPVSYIMPDNDGSTSYMQYSERTGKRKHRTCTLVGELRTSFVIPESSEINLFNVDEIKRPDEHQEMGTDSDKPYQFSFAERLDGWIIERSVRQCGIMHDMTFYHTKSKRLFRSTNEVANFLIYEVYPRSRNALTNRRMTPRNGSNEATTSNSGMMSEAPALNSGRMPELATTSNSGGSPEATEEPVADFFARSLRNMLLMS